MTPHAVSWGRYHIDLYHFMIDFRHSLQQKRTAWIGKQVTI
jgi:hypothetical protein